MDRCDAIGAEPGDNLLKTWAEMTAGNDHNWVRKMIARWCKNHCVKNEEVFEMFEAAFTQIEDEHAAAGELTKELAERRRLLTAMLFVGIEDEFGIAVKMKIRGCL